MNDTEAEERLIGSVMKMAEAIPLESSCAVLGVELIRTMGEGRDEQTKLVMMAAALAAALKVINRQKGSQ